MYKFKRKFSILAAIAIVSALILSLASCQSSGGGWNYIMEKETPELIVGLDATFAPMGYTDENGEIVGFDVDLAREVAAILEVGVKFQPIEWSAKEMELTAKRIDCIWNGMSKTPDRDEAMALTKPYMNNQIIIVGKDAQTYTSLDQFKGKKLGIQAGSSALEILQNNEIYDDIKSDVSELPTYDECFLELNTGRIEFIVIDKVAFDYKNTLFAEEEKLQVSPASVGDDLYVVGCRKGETDLVEKIEDAIQQLIDNGKAAEISKKWFGTDVVLSMK